MFRKTDTHREHFENLQPVGRPAFLGFVDWQGEVNVSSVLREEQHQKYSPVDTKIPFGQIIWPRYFLRFLCEE